MFFKQVIVAATLSFILIFRIGENCQQEDWLVCDFIVFKIFFVECFEQQLVLILSYIQ